MKGKGVIVSKEFLSNMLMEYPEVEIAHYHEHGDFFYYSADDLKKRTDFYWVEDKNDLKREEGIVLVTEIIPFVSDYEERCWDCHTNIPSGVIRYRRPITRCQSCFEKELQKKGLDHD